MSAYIELVSLWLNSSPADQAKILRDLRRITAEEEMTPTPRPERAQLPSRPSPARRARDVGP